jgi:hypothetical protein
MVVVMAVGQALTTEADSTGARSATNASAPVTRRHPAPSLTDSVRPDLGHAGR